MIYPKKEIQEPNDLPNNALCFIKRIIELRNGVWAMLSKSYMERALAEELPSYPWDDTFYYDTGNGEGVIIYREVIQKKRTKPKFLFAEAL